MRVFILVLLSAFFLSGCTGSAEMEESYEEGYNDGYEDGVSAGREEEREAIYEELLENGIIREIELVYLSMDGSNVFHGYYCEKADHSKEVEKSIAESWGYVPCEECGGDGVHTYAD